MVGGRLLRSPYVGVAEFRHLYLEAGHTGQASKSTIAAIHDTIIGGMQRFFLYLESHWADHLVGLDVFSCNPLGLGSDF